MEIRDSVGQRVEEIRKWYEGLAQGGGVAEIERQHSKGKLTARERIKKLLDPGTFKELDLNVGSLETGFDVDAEMHPGDGVAVGYGEVNGRPIFVWAQDATVLGGTWATVHMRKIIMVMERALNARIPIVGIIDSEGPRVEDVIQYHPFFSPERMCYWQTMSSGVIPQIALVMGPCTSELALCTQLNDFVFMVGDTSYMHLAATPSGVRSEELGNAWMQAKTTGCCDVFSKSDDECLEECRHLLSFLPANCEERPPKEDTGDDSNRREEELLGLVPFDGRFPYSMYKLISLIADNGDFLEIKRYWTQNLIVGFLRLGGTTVGVVANNPQAKGGCMTMDAADKMACFVRFCDAFSIPLLWICDTPAFLPAIEEETRGLIRHGARMICANSEASVPQITMVVRKAYGGGNLAMPGIGLGGDMVVSWPQMDKGLMGPEGAVAILYRKELSKIEDETERKKLAQIRIKEIADRLEMLQSEASPIFIDPRDTRPFLIQAFRVMANRKQELPSRKHENFRV